MGRPRDQFAWAQVEVLENGTWKCIHCKKVYRGAASRIRNHFSGQGNGIAACEKASEAIQNEALNQITGKRVRGNSSFDLPSSSNATLTRLQDPSSCSIVKRAREEIVTDAFLKLLMSYSSSPDRNFNEFLERARKYGVPSSFLVNDSNVTEDIHQHMLMLKESWKTSGCTLMVFSGTSSSPVHNVGTCVVGFYCPKGIIFMEAPHPDTDFQGFRVAMKQHEPSLDFDDAISYVILRHNVNSNGGSGSDWTRRVKDECFVKPHLCRCLRDEIQEICIDRCRQSEWAEDMIKNAVEIHEKLCRHEILRLGYYEILEKNSESFTDFDNTKGIPAIRLSIFLSIMRLNFDLRGKLLDYIERNSLGSEVAEDLEVIFIDSNQYDIRKFWDQGRKLQLIFTFILKLLDLMDTLVPTSGILAMALDMVEYKLCGGGDDPILKEGDESFTFWKEIEPELRGTIEDNYIRKAAMYMNPLYCTRLRNISQRSDQENIQGPQLQTEVIEALIKFVSVCETEVERDVLIEQVQLYDNVFSEVFEDDMKRRNDHALKLWEEHGCELPLLQKHAITLLSQPLNCMCKQVKKHMYELNGADDYILRLNVRMMQEFKLLSDDICSPTGVLFGGWLTS